VPGVAPAPARLPRHASTVLLPSPPPSEVTAERIARRAAVSTQKLVVMHSAAKAAQSEPAMPASVARLPAKRAHQGQGMRRSAARRHASRRYPAALQEGRAQEGPLRSSSVSR